MRLLIDTHLLLWAANEPDRLPPAAYTAIADPANTPVFSVVSIWEVAIKQTLLRSHFVADAHLLRAGLLANGYEELPVLGQHALAILALPLVHGDPFDRLLLAQATAERMMLMTSDAALGRYPGPVLPV